MTKIIAIFIILLSLLLACCTGISFDSEKWKNWNENESNMHLRLDMTDDLINNYNLIGKTHNEIIMLLGKPSNGTSSTDNDYYYSLGPCRRGIDYGTLYIEFKNGKVVHVEKHCH